LGTVTTGAGRGRGIGFPTANLAAHNERFPPGGVYAVRVLMTLAGLAAWRTWGAPNGGGPIVCSKSTSLTTRRLLRS
jgi:riboflavin kinase/FMN adenylyltransferase